MGMDAAACTLFRAGCHNHDNPGMLSQYLDYQRETMLPKTDGLTRQHLARQHPHRSSHSLGCSITCRWWKRTGSRCASGRHISGSARPSIGMKPMTAGKLAAGIAGTTGVVLIITI